MAIMTLDGSIGFDEVFKTMRSIKNKTGIEDTFFIFE